MKERKAEKRGGCLEMLGDALILREPGRHEARLLFYFSSFHFISFHFTLFYFILF